MYPPQPPGGQQFTRPVPGQPSSVGHQPYAAQPWHGEAEQADSSGITSWTAALLGCFVAFGTQASMVLILLDQVAAEVALVIFAVVVAAVLSVPALIGAAGIFARKRFGRWVLVGGLVLPTLLYGVITYKSSLLWPLCFFVGSVAAIALALLPTTGNYLRGGVRNAAMPGPPNPPGHPMGPQSFGGYQGVGSYEGLQTGPGDPRWNPQWTGQGYGHPPSQY